MELTLESVLKDAKGREASDIYIVVGKALSIKVAGKITEVTEDPLMPADTKDLLMEIYRLASNRSLAKVEENGDDDFSFSLPGVARFRVSAYKQRGTLSAVIRIVAFELPDPQHLGIPRIALDQGLRTKGLVLVTGPTGSGKSTTLSCIIDEVNNVRNAHIITLEDPIEFLHQHKQSIVSQREISLDTVSYPVALKAALRQAPNVILIGELRDAATIEIAMTAAETGHLVISTLHTVGSANTIDRIVDAFPPGQQGQIRLQLAMVLSSVISQQLIPGADGSTVPVFEIMIVNDAIKNMVRESKIHQIDSVITSSAAEGMVTMDAELLRLAKEGRITPQTAVAYAMSPELTKKRVSGL
ncbi:MAG: PilT/PilU family type 4a pilus ATPase [Clostridiales Family XIII bacterium]|jgi:twitching motility protein PilT|nr:PilT/PilU family type 4a pilus ATPase [Clostridiales Family XIII bacterium]